MVAIAETQNKVARHFACSLLVSALIALIAVPPAEAAPGLTAQAQAARSENPGQLQQLGDQYVSQERLKEAADAYAQALSLGREQFTLDERVRMAIYLSWENRLDAAIDELQRVARQDPGHVAARIHLARTYSWAGDLDNAIRQADAALRLSPGNQEALLIKADALEWKGSFREAIPIYQKLLEDENRFDAGLGLSYALLSAGNQADASRNARNLAPASDRDRTRLDRLQNEIDGVIRPRVELRYNQYRDSDDNQADRYSLLYGFGVGNQTVELNLKRTDTRSQTGSNSSDAASFSVVSNLAEGVRLRTSVGLRRPGLEEKRNFATGQIRIEAVVSNVTITGAAGTDLFDDTSDLIESHVRVNSYGGEIAKPWTSRFSTSGAYTYRTFSDGNRAQDIQISPQYAVSLAPRIALGYRFRFLDFREQSGSGFFDPDNYASHRLFGSVSIEKEKVSVYLDVFTGKQRFVRYAVPTDDWIAGGSASIAFKPVRQLLIEVNGEGGDFIGESIAGFRYATAGVRVAYRF